MLEVTRAAFYKWLGRKPSATQEKQELIASEIKRIHALPRHQDYGSPRMHRELVSQGDKCSENTVAKLMRENQIQARNKPKFRISTTDSNHNLPIAPNRLNQQFSTSSINQVWLTDFTYIPTQEGFSYLCAFRDLCSRRIVGWAMSRKIDAQLAIDALNQAVALREPPRDLIIHSDRGSQFASNAFRKEASPKLLEVEKWSPEGDTVALRNSTFIRRQQPTGRPPWTTVISLRLLGKFLPAKLEASFGIFFAAVSAR